MSGQSFFGDMLQTITERGRQLLSLGAGEDGPAAHRKRASLEEICDSLLRGRGEASGMALASLVFDRWSGLTPSEKIDFMTILLRRFGTDEARLSSAVDAYRAAPSPETARILHQAAEPRRQELIRRLNLAPGGVGALVRMRADLLGMLTEHPELHPVDADFSHLFGSWFNRGFLVLKSIDWSTPASVLEKIIRYEAVHEIDDWEELRRRVAPEDRRCFAFFHPRLPEEPLIFVEVALTTTMASTIAELLDGERTPIRAEDATAAVFYSISNCQEGLRGVSFGNFLIKQVAADLQAELPGLATFVTLSPIPGFAAWLDGRRKAENFEAEELDALVRVDDPTWADDPAAVETLGPILARATARYFLTAKNAQGLPLDAVARFHLGNGARLERINPLGDRSRRGMRGAHGMMVNYLYELSEIEANHEAFFSKGEIAASSSVQRLARPARSAPKGASGPRRKNEKAA
ncbi:MAG TPA: malonyl-CoA decarboxylase [Hansschlegelia sp.]